MKSSPQSEAKNTIQQSKLPFLHPNVEPRHFRGNNLLIEEHIDAVKEWFKENPGKNITPTQNKIIVKGKSLSLPYPVVKAKDDKGKEFYFAIYDRQRIGKGGFGRVVTAFDVDNKSWVAIKFQNVIDKIIGRKNLSRESKQEEINEHVDRIITEASIVAQVQKDSTYSALSSLFKKPIQDMRSVGMQIMTIMPLEEGRNLFSIAGDPPVMSSGWWIEIAIRICESVQNLHELNILHRDIKLSNFLLNPVTGQVSLVDFGLAVSVEEGSELKFSSTDYCGTPGYIAPELNMESPRHEFNEKTEVYALGITLLELNLFSNDKFPNRDLSYGMENLIRRMLAENPQERISLKEAIEKLKKCGILHHQIFLQI